MIRRDPAAEATKKLLIGLVIGGLGAAALGVGMFIITHGKRTEIPLFQSQEVAIALLVLGVVLLIFEVVLVVPALRARAKARAEGNKTVQR